MKDKKLKNRKWNELIQAWMDGELCDDCKAKTFSCDRCYQYDAQSNEKDNQSKREK